MKNLLLLFLLFPVLLFAQISNYELEFNSSTQDYVEIPNTSSVIANKIAFSISGWVNPQSNSTHGGIMGFRNNVDADFYLLQLQNTNNIEARFRGSSGVSYDIVAANILDFNQWQHLAFTYDGSYIRLFKDGALVDSSVANGIIGQNTLPLQLGKLDWQTTGFYLNGRLDEIRLWDVALSQAEINNWMCIPLDLTHPNYSNLMGYWQLNEGIGITATDLSVNGNNGTLTNNPIWQNSTTCLGNTSQVLKTYIPDDNFEQALINLGYDNVIDDSVITTNINSITNLDINMLNITDLTGIEDFISLIDLDCSYNGFNNLSPDLSSNVLLEKLIIGYNGMINLDVSNNTELQLLECGGQFLDSLDVSNNSELIHLWCGDNSIVHLNGIQNLSNLSNLYCQTNFITELNISNNLQLDTLVCDDNILLTSLDLRNGNNTNLFLEAFDNPGLNCIDVDDVYWSSSNWTVINGNIDVHHYFSIDCSVTAIGEEENSERELIKVIDVLGREKSGNKQELLFYIYKDGTVKKRIVIE